MLSKIFSVLACAQTVFLSFVLKRITFPFCCIVLWGVLFSSSANAQVAAGKVDSTSFPVDSTVFLAFNEDGFSLYFNQVYVLQHPLDGFQLYRQKGMGANGGQADLSYSFPELLPVGFRRSINPYASFGFSPNRRRFYDGKRPYTAIDFYVGQGKDQQVRVIHAHPFGRNANVSLGFQRVRSEGFYQRQNTSNTSIDLNGWYRSKSKRYALLTDMIWTGIANAENGGLKNDTDFTNAVQLDRQLVSVNLNLAQTRQRDRSFYAKQVLGFGAVVDTLIDKKDTSKVVYVHAPVWTLSHTLKISDQSWSYRDGEPLGGFYENIYLDSTITKDSTYVWRVENGVWLDLLERNAGLGKKFSAQGGLRFEYGELKNDTIRHRFNNLIASAKIKLPGSERVRIMTTLQGDYVLQGYNVNDYSASARAQARLKKGWSIIAEIQANAEKADYLFQHYSGNHFRWQNDFGQVLQQRAMFSVIYKRLFSFSAVVFSSDHPLYFDSLGLPHQFDGMVQGAQLEGGFQIHKKYFHTWWDLRYTSLKSGTPLHLPQIQVLGSIYFDGFVFKKALRFQAGADVFFRTGYQVNGWLPNMAQYFSQSGTKVTDYVYIDPWVSIKVKPVRVFVKADHVNAGLFGRTYFETLHQPQYDFALRFGVSWIFND